MVFTFLAQLLAECDITPEAGAIPIELYGMVIRYQDETGGMFVLYGGQGLAQTGEEQVEIFAAATALLLGKKQASQVITGNGLIRTGEQISQQAPYFVATEGERARRGRGREPT
jgi:hypothetical protein